MKRLVSIILSILMLTSLCVTGTVMDASAATATVNGVNCNVGDTVTFTLKTQFAEKLEDYQANILYSEEGLALIPNPSYNPAEDDETEMYSYEIFDTTGNIIFNPQNTEAYPGQTVISFNASIAKGGYDYTTERAMIAIPFKVTKAGTWTISTDWKVASGKDGTQYVAGGEILSQFTQNPVVQVTAQEDTKPTETKPTETTPVAEKATVNGVQYNVGDVVDYTLKAQFDKKLEDYEARILYSEEGLSLILDSSYVPDPDIPDAPAYKHMYTTYDGDSCIVNTEDTETVPGRSIINFNANVASGGFDYKTEKPMITVPFKITKAGTWTIGGEVALATSVAGDDYVGDNGEQLIPFVSSDDVVKNQELTPTVTVPTQTTETKPTETTPSKATINGVEVSVGETVTYKYMLQVPQKIKTFQLAVEYGNKTTGDATGISVESVAIGDSVNTDSATHIPGYVYASGFNNNGYDYTSKRALVTIQFKISQIGTYNVSGIMEAMMGFDEVDYVETETPFNYENVIEKSAETKPTETTPTETTPTETTQVLGSYSVVTNLVNAKLDNDATSVKAGESYSVNIIPNDGYEFVAAPTVMVGTKAVTPVKKADGSYSVSIQEVDGDIIITGTATQKVTETKPTETTPTTPTTPSQPKTFNVSCTLTNAVGTNNATTIKEGETYSNVITAMVGYEMQSVVVTMGGQKVEPTVVNGVYSITVKATGDIVIVATATPSQTVTTASVPSTTKPQSTTVKPQPTTVKPQPTTAPASPSLDTVNKTINKTNTDKGDIKGSTFSKLKLKGIGGKKKVTLKWTKVAGSKGYIIYGSPCGKNNKLKKIATVKASKKSYVYKKLKKGKYYKFVVMSYKVVKGKKYVTAISKVVHVTTKGGKYGNPTKIKIKKATITLKKNKTYKVSKNILKILSSKKVKNHISLRYELSNKKILKISNKGKITAKKKGTCTVYVYAQNGIYVGIKIKVK